jgi:autotransporter translocation and assembly factor TamB
LSGSLDDPQGRADASIEDLWVDGSPLGTLRLQAVAATQRVRIEALELIRDEDRLFARGILRLPELWVEEAQAEFSLRDIGLILGQLPAGREIGRDWPLAGRLRGTARIAGPWQDPDGKLALDIEELRLRDRPFGSGSLHLHKKGPVIAADPLVVTRGADRLRLQGGFDLAGRRFGATRIELAAADIGPYLAAFDLEAPKLTGRVDLSLEGSGPLLEPDFVLDAFLERFQSGDWALSDNRVQAAGTEGRVHFERIASLTPIGKVEISGSLEADRTAGVFTARLDRAEITGTFHWP